VAARRTSALLVCLVSSAALLAQDQASRPSFKAAIGLVQIDVSVLDGKRQPIRGLQASDFTVLEDGQPRPIRVFEAVDLPARAPLDPAPDAAAALATPVANHVVNNQIGDQSGRLVFILMDHTIPVGEPVLAAKRVATAAIDALGPTDLAAVVTTGGLTPQTLTSDRARLRRAIDEGDWSTIEDPAVQELPTFGKYDPLSDGRCLCGLCVLETVTNLAEAAREAPGRNKLLLFIGSSIIVQGGPRAASADVGCDERIERTRRIMVDALARSHLTVHSIDPTGLASSMCQGSCNGKPGQDGQLMRRRRWEMTTVERMQAQGSLDVLPELTGGRKVVNTNAPEEKVPEIFHESDAYYVLAFEPAGPAAKSAHGAIEVKVARRDARVNTTRYAPPPTGTASNPSRKGAPVTPIDFALAGLLPEARVPLTMSLAAFAGGDGAKGYVTVSLNADAFDRTTPVGAPLDVALAVLDQRGRRVTLRRGTGSTAIPGDLRTHVVLAPGEYELRAALQPRGTDTAASVFSQLSVPAFADAPLSMSDLVLGTREIGVPSADPAAPAIPIVISTARTFPRKEAAWAFAEVYQGTQRSDALQKVDVRIVVVDRTGTTVHAESHVLDASVFDRRRAAIRVQLPLDVLKPGTYVLHVDATRGSLTAARSVAFAVN